MFISTAYYLKNTFKCFTYNCSAVVIYQNEDYGSKGSNVQLLNFADIREANT
jgi:hypothetical protein